MDGQTMRDLDSGLWNLLNPSLCPCGGHGWILSDFDTLHQCRIHGQGVPRPDPDSDEAPTFDHDGHLVKMYRDAYSEFARRAKAAGFGGSWAEFRRQCRASFDGAATPALWVNAAEHIAERYEADKADASAKREGFACDLERRWADQAAEEKRERQGGLFH